MISKRKNIKKEIDPIDSINNIQKGLFGLSEIFRMNFDDDDFFRKIADDNIMILGKEIVKILGNDIDKAELVKEFQNLQFDDLKEEAKKNIFLNP